MPFEKLVSGSYIEHRGAGVDEFDCLRRSDLRPTSAVPDLGDHDDRCQSQQGTDQIRVISSKFDDLGHDDTLVPPGGSPRPHKLAIIPAARAPELVEREPFNTLLNPPMCPRRPTRFLATLPAALVAVTAIFLMGSADDPEVRLEELRDRIRRIQAEIEEETERRDQATATLRNIERKASMAANTLRSTETKLAESRVRQTELQAKVEAGKRRLNSGRQALADQIRTVYAAGRAERLRLLMNQEDPSLVGRMLVYYRYLSESRVTEINSVTEEIADLASAERQLARNTEKLESLAAAQAAEARDLKASRQERAQVLAQLETRIRDKRDEAEKLAAEAAALEDLIEELRRALIELPGTDREAFSKVRGKLEWPTNGVLLNDFGQPRAGGSIKWNGVVIGTDQGRDVRAVYHGRVAYADWLPGMGLLLIIEHGDGYMSLYGHNETLYKSVGDWVAPGDVVASAGDTGGRSRAALYFEIRRNGRPENPHGWFRSGLAAR